MEGKDKTLEGSQGSHLAEQIADALMGQGCLDQRCEIEDAKAIIEEAIRRAPYRTRPEGYKPCTCLGTCKGKEGLAPGWRCALDGRLTEKVGG